MSTTLHPPRVVPLPQWRATARGGLALGPGGKSPAFADPSGRSIGYVRLSVTRACSMRCSYCRPGFDRGRDRDEFSADDFAFLVGYLHERFGLRKVRITGGEPTVRRDLPQIISAVRDVGVFDIAMTTNGLTLERDAEALRAAGLRRVNVSLDALDRERFAELTGVDGLDRVRAGIDAALAAGYDAVKINTVVVADQNEAELPALLAYAAELGVTIRFIELMPMGPIAERWEQRYVSADRVRASLGKVVARWNRAEQHRPNKNVSDAARLWIAHLRDGRTARVGFITPMSEHFCDTCDRLRITATGDVYPCLMDAPRGNLGDAIRRRARDEFDAALNHAYQHKQSVHPAIAPGVMTHLGG